MLTGLGSATAADLLLPATEADIQAASGKTVDFGRLAKQTRLVRLDPTALGRHVVPPGLDAAPDRGDRARALDGTIAIEPFPGTKATFQRTDVDAAGDSGYAWTGRTASGEAGTASLIIDAGQVTGDIRLGRRVFRIAPVTGVVHQVVEIDPTRFPPD